MSGTGTQWFFSDPPFAAAASPKCHFAHFTMGGRIRGNNVPLLHLVGSPPVQAQLHNGMHNDKKKDKKMGKKMGKKWSIPNEQNRMKCNSPECNTFAEAHLPKRIQHPRESTSVVPLLRHAHAYSHTAAFSLHVGDGGPPSPAVPHTPFWQTAAGATANLNSSWGGSKTGGTW